MINWLKIRLKHCITKNRFPNCKLYFSAVVEGDSCLGRHTVIFPYSCIIDTNIGDCTYIQKNTVIINADVGKYCSIASNVAIGIANHPTHMVSTSPVFYDSTQPLPFFLNQKKYLDESDSLTTIGSDVWIGQGAIVKAGLTVGVGAVIGAGAVVTKNVQPYSIVGGVPARHLKWRFNEGTRVSLVETQWWELTFEQLAAFSGDFEDPEKFIRSVMNVC